MMKNEHIIQILEEQPLHRLSDSQRATIEAHLTNCSDCLQAYQAAVISAEILHARADEIIEPTPFFKTRVMAALRERQAEQSFSFTAMWRAARTVIASMVVGVAILLTLNFYLGGIPVTATHGEVSANDSIYSPEWVILENGNNSDELTDSQVLTTLYELR
jgi:predicted anti-sigma-YlaC factor YlaD